MKKLVTLFFAMAMMFSIAFIGDALSSNGTMSASAQTVTVRKHRRHGIAHRTYRGGKYVAHKTYRGGRYVVRKSYHGGRYVVRKTVKGTRYVSHKTKRGTKSVFHRVKKAVN